MLSVHTQNQLEELADLLGAEVVDSFCNDGELQLCMSAKTPIFVRFDVDHAVYMFMSNHWCFVYV